MDEESGDDGAVISFWGLSPEQIDELAPLDTLPPEPPDSNKGAG